MARLCDLTWRLGQNATPGAPAPLPQISPAQGRPSAPQLRMFEAEHEAPPSPARALDPPEHARAR